MAKAPRLPKLPRGPLFRPLDVKSVKDDTLDISIEATAEECAAIAAATELPAVASLSARFRIHRRAGGRFDVSGLVRGQITQICVVTLEAFDSTISQPVELAFAPIAPTLAGSDRDDRRTRAGAGAPVKPVTVPGSDDQEDPPDPIIDDAIDLGAVAVEFLTLACDPYPRKPGVHFDDMITGDKDEPTPSAFAALARLKDGS